MRFYKVVGWENYQHYKDRNPPWIKLHRELLTSNTWVTLDDASRVLAVASMLLAAATGNKIPADPDYLRRVAYLNRKADLNPLLKVNFIEMIDDIPKTASTLQADASTLQADASRLHTNARPETETEKRREEQKDSARGSRLPDDWKLTDITRSAASEARRKANLPVIDLDTEATKFANHWHSATGKGSVKRDWHRAFINWALNGYGAKALSPAQSGFQLNAPPPDPDAKAKARKALADMIGKGMNIQTATDADVREMIREGLLTVEQVLKSPHSSAVSGKFMAEL